MQDFHGKGADFSRQLMADVAEQVRKAISGISATVAAQQDGAIQSDQHRILNFTGPGVVVTDDPNNRRINIAIAGSPTSGTTTTFGTAAVAAFKMLDLWNGTSNNAPPANWTTLGFNDSGWGAAVLSGEQTSVGYIPFPGSSIIWVVNPGRGPSTAALLRHTFTLSAGTVQSASINLATDSAASGGGIYVNGTLVQWPGSPTVPGWITPGQAPPNHIFTIPAGLLNAGGSNVIAIEVTNDPTDVNGAIDYVLTVGMTSLLGGSAVELALASDVTMVNINTYYDGPALTLGVGTWFIIATLTGSDTVSPAHFAAKLWNGTAVASSSQDLVGGANYDTSITLSAFRTIASGTEVWKISAANGTNGGSAGRIKAATNSNASGNNATIIRAFRIA